jgi:MFS family permease
MVLVVAVLGWVFDSMDASIYSIVHVPALTDLLGPGASKGDVSIYGGYIFSVFIIGWALGGILFGILGDYIGRARVMMITILFYAVFTGLAAFAHTWWELGLYRFFCGLGIGGEWAAGATLVAETWPDKTRARAASVMQSAWAVGYFIAAVIHLYMSDLGWRAMFLVGLAPALVAFLIRAKVNEPECWENVQKRRKGVVKEEAAESSRLRRLTLAQLFEPWIRRDTIVGTLLATVAAFGLWGATNWTPSILREALASRQMAENMVNDLVSFAVMSLNAGAFLGYLAFAPLAERFGRKPAFLFFLVGSALMLPLTFLSTRDYAHILILLPLLGFFNNGIFSGFPIYLPELYPTHMRTTGSGFCFNAGRVLSASGPFITGHLVVAMGSYGMAASAVGLAYIVGMVTLVFARETRGQSLALTCEIPPDGPVARRVRV